MANQFGGTPKYGVMVHGSQPSRRTDGSGYTGEAQVVFGWNVVDPAAGVSALVTFTNARATVLPCELYPVGTPLPAGCPSWATPTFHSCWATGSYNEIYGTWQEPDGRNRVLLDYDQ